MTVNNPQKPASVQVSRTELDWLVGMSHGRFSVIIAEGFGPLPKNSSPVGY